MKYLILGWRSPPNRRGRRSGARTRRRDRRCDRGAWPPYLRPLLTDLIMGRSTSQERGPQSKDLADQGIPRRTV